MHNYLNFKPRFDRTPRVITPIVSEVYFAWCHQENGKWEEADSLISPSNPAISIEDLEEDRASKFDYDYEKGYFDNYYTMLVMKYRKGDKEYILFLTPEHAHGIIEHAINCDDYGVMIQPEYSWEELNFEAKEEDNEEDS